MSNTTFPTGWINRPEAVAAYITERERANDPCTIGGPFTARPELAGFWPRLVQSGVFAVLLYQAEQELLGQYAPADFQRRGTCFPAGSMVWMADGTEKPIQDVRVGDEVLSHTGLPRKVLDIGCRTYSGNLVTVSLKGWPHAISMTEEHPVARYPQRPRMKKLRSDATNRKRRKAVYLPLTWTAAGQLAVNDYVLCPRPNSIERQQLLDVMDFIPNEKIVRVFKQPIEVGDDGVRCKQSSRVVSRYVACDERFCRMLGLYAAEGSVEYRATKDGRVIPTRLTWSFGSDEQHLANEVHKAIADVFGVPCSIVHEADHNVIRVRCTSKAVASLIAGVCPGNALTKRVPEFVFRSPQSHKMAFLRGWLDGDGHFRCDREQGRSSTVTRTSLIGVTSSAGLAADLCRLSAACGLHCGWNPRKRAAHQNVRAETVNFYGDEALKLYPERQAGAVRETFTTNPPKQWRSVEHGWARRVSEVGRIPVNGIAVYNLEVEEDHSYIVAGLAVHNCVSRGTYRAVQTGYWWQLAERRMTGRPLFVAYEPIYAGSRVNVGGGALGRADGSVGAWAAKWVHNYGVITRKEYPAVDLSHDQEQWAVDHGMPGVGVPRDLALEGVAHCCDSYHVADGHDLADCLAAGYAAAMCSQHQQSDQRDQNGECGYKGPTAHCEAITGVYVRASWDGNPRTIYDHTGFVDQQSWGNIPGGPDTLRYYRGDAKLRQGAYGTPMRAVQSRIRTGETWAFKLRDGWRAGSVAEAVK